MPLHPRTCSGLYSISCLLDALDGYAARYFEQSTRFGAVLDMVTDRCTTACLLVFLASAWPRYSLIFQGLISLDLASHYIHMYATLIMGGSDQSHKKVDASRSWILNLYYTNKVCGICFLSSFSKSNVYRPCYSSVAALTRFSSSLYIFFLSHRHTCLLLCSKLPPAMHRAPSNLAALLVARHLYSSTQTVLALWNWQERIRWTRLYLGRSLVFVSPLWFSSNGSTVFSWSRPAVGWQKETLKWEGLLDYLARTKWHKESCWWMLDGVTNYDERTTIHSLACVTGLRSHTRCCDGLPLEAEKLNVFVCYGDY